MNYLAVPYSHAHQDIREIRARIATWATGELMSCGYQIFSPITHSHPVALGHDLPGDWEYWAEFDRRHIQMCDRVFVLCLPGWSSSRGISAEISLAEELGKEVCLIHWEDML